MKNQFASEKQGIIFKVVLVLGIIYFALFIFPNLTGARTPEMLQVFQVDEYAQYPHVIRILTPGDTFYQSFRNFIIYLHYFYGYIFYFVSAIVLLPLRLGLGDHWTEQTPLLVAFLRQGVSVLPALIAVFLLTYIQTGFRSWVRSLSIFLLLLSVPALVANNLWWHPDSLGLLLVVLVFFFLERDGLRFRKNFFLAAATCGAAVGTKYLGVFFVLVIPIYFIFGIANQKLSWRQVLLRASGFLAVMAAFVVITNPLLLLPQERMALIQYQFLQYQQTMEGIILHNTQPFLENGRYPADFRQNYGELVFVILGLMALGVGLLRSSTRLRATLMLAFMLPFTYTIINAATRRIHYWLPIMIPLFSCLVFLFPEQKTILASNNKQNSPHGLFKFSRFFSVLAVAIIFTQFFLFIQTDLYTYQETLHRELTSDSLVFNHQVTQLLSNLPVQDKKYVAFRDWHIYFPADQQWRVEMTWDIIGENYIRNLNPDLILLEEENILLYNNPQSQEKAVNPEDFKQAGVLYQAANTDHLTGYRLFYRSPFGIALIRDDLFKSTQ